MTQFSFPSGATARTLRDSGDFQIVAEVFTKAMGPDSDQAMATGEEIENEFTNISNFNVADGLLIVEADDTPIGYILARWTTELSGTHIYRHMGTLLPEFRRRGIGTAMVAWAQGYLHRIAATHDAEDQQFQTDAQDADRGAVALMVGNGYAPVARHASMLRPNLDSIPNLNLPEGVEIRPVQPEHLRAIWEADVDAFRDHFGSIETDEKDWARFSKDPNQDSTLWKVAWHGDRVVGQVRSYINHEANAAYRRRRGYTEDISTAREWRGQGIASALICESLRELRAHGLEEAGLGVHVDNPTGAFPLYEGLGFQVTTAAATYQRPI